jgi:hypothetical protein
MSLPSRLMNIYAAPGEVFDSIKSVPPAAANWLVPVLLACLIGVLNVWVMFSQPAVQQQMREQQAMKFEQMVEDGKLSSEQAQGIQENLGDTQFLIAKIAGTVGVVVVSFLWLFIVSLVLWLLARWMFKSRFAYMKTVEMVGLCTMIGALGALIQIFIIVATGNMHATLSPALLIGDFDIANRGHQALSSLNLITLWYTGVLSLGLARLTGRSFVSTAMWLFGAWLVLRAGMILSGLSAAGM